MNQHIKFNLRSFKMHKIMSVRIRNSICYMRYPYILELHYDKPSAPHYIAIQNSPLLIPIQNDVTVHSWKYRTRQAALDDLDNIRCQLDSTIPVFNQIRP